MIERFDSTIGAGSVLMPFGGKYQRTPTQVMAALIPVLPGQETKSASVMSWGFRVPDFDNLSKFDLNQDLNNNLNDLNNLNQESGEEIYFRARDSVILSLAKLVAAGADCRDAYLSFQEYFEKLGQDARRWGKPFAALLGALDAQIGLETAAIGGKDSMSGSFLNLDVPPTLISFAVAPIDAPRVLSPELKAPGNYIYAFCAGDNRKNINYNNIKEMWSDFHALCEQGIIKSAWAVENNVAEAIINMSFGNRIGFQEIDNNLRLYNKLDAFPGVIIAELSEELDNDKYNKYAVKIGETTESKYIAFGGERVSIAEMKAF